MIRASGATIAPFPPWLRPFLSRGVLAITLGRRVYIAANVAEEEIEQLLRHELVHVGQIARLGILRFYWRSVFEYITLRRRGVSYAAAYQRIALEMEAFAAQQIL